MEGVASAGVLDVSRADGILANTAAPTICITSASSASCTGTLFVLHVGPPWQMLP